MVRVAGWNDTAEATTAIFACLISLTGSAGATLSNLGIGRSCRILALNFLTSISRARSGRYLFSQRSSLRDSSLDVSFFLRSKDFLAGRHLLNQSGHNRKYLWHTGCGVRCIHNDKVMQEHIHARILDIHTGDNRDAQTLFHCLTDSTAGNAATSGIGAGPATNTSSGSHFFYHLNGIGCSVQILSEIVVTADNG